MITGLYSAATAMDAATSRHAVAAENLAHAHHPGFRRRIVQQAPFKDVMAATRDTSGMSQSMGTSVVNHVDFSAGLHKPTGRKLDLALTGDGFFVVDGPDGPLYTRNGSFHVNAEGQLVTVDQLPVRGDTGILTLPPNTTPESLHVTPAGALSANGIPIGQLELATFDDPSVLTSEGVSLFSAPDNVDPGESAAQVSQGFVEQSNVAPIDELINIIVSSRQYESAQKALTAISEAVQHNVGIG